MRVNIVSLISTFLGLYYSFVEGLDTEQSLEYDDDIDPSVRILNGQEARAEDFPYVVKIIINGNMLCTGSIISDEWAITAGHCLYQKPCAGIGIYPGVGASSNFVQPTYCVVHPEYTGSQFGIDLGLLKLPENIRQYTSIKPIPLPPQGMNFFQGTAAVTAGFGRTEKGLFPDRLLKADVVVVNWESCNDNWRADQVANSPDRNPPNLPRSIICTNGYQENPSCNGDSGGPVIINGYLAGVLSLVWHLDNSETCVIGLPNTYVAVASHLPWIHSHINN